MQETLLWSLGWEDPLEKGKATHSSILSWRSPWTIVYGVAKSRTWLSIFYFHITSVSWDIELSRFLFHPLQVTVICIFHGTYPFLIYVNIKIAMPDLLWFVFTRCWLSSSFYCYSVVVVQPLSHLGSLRPVDRSTAGLPSHHYLSNSDCEPCHAGPPETDGSWRRVLTQRGPLEKGMAGHFCILALRAPWTVWKGKR